MLRKRINGCNDAYVDDGDGDDDDGDDDSDNTSWFDSADSHFPSRH